jgi:hypothetical protein
MKEDSLKSKFRDSKNGLTIARAGKYFIKNDILQNYDNVGLLIRTPNHLYIAFVHGGLKVV